MGRESQEIVVTVETKRELIRIDANNVVEAASLTKYVYHLLDDVSIDGPSEVTDRPAIDLVEVQNNRLMARTLTFRVRAAGGVYSIRKEHGIGTLVYQEQADRSSGMPDEGEMRRQIEQLKSLRSKLVSVYSIVEPNFVGIVQDVRIAKNNKSRTVANAEVVVREALRGTRTLGRFDFVPFDPAKNPDDGNGQIIGGSVHQEVTGNARLVMSDLVGRDIRFHSSSGLLGFKGANTAKFANGQLPPEYGTPSNVSQTSAAIFDEKHAAGNPDSVLYERTRRVYESLSFPEKANFVPDSVWTVEWDPILATAIQINVGFGMPAPPVNILADVRNGEALRWLINTSAVIKEGGVATNQRTVRGFVNPLYSKDFAPFTPVYVKDFVDFNAIDPNAKVPLKKKSSTTFVDEPKRLRRHADAVMWLQTDDFESQEIPASERTDSRVTRRLYRFPRYVDGVLDSGNVYAYPKLGEIGRKYYLVVVFGFGGRTA